MRISQIISYLLNIKIDPAVFLSFLIMILSFIFLFLLITNTKLFFNLKIFSFIIFFSLILISLIFYAIDNKIQTNKFFNLKTKKIDKIKNYFNFENLREKIYFDKMRNYFKYNKNKNKNNKTENLNNLVIYNNQFRNINLYSDNSKSILFKIIKFFYKLYIKITNKLTLFLIKIWS